MTYYQSPDLHMWPSLSLSLVRWGQQRDEIQSQKTINPSNWLNGVRLFLLFLVMETTRGPARQMRGSRITV